MAAVMIIARSPLISISAVMAAAAAMEIGATAAAAPMVATATAIASGATVPVVTASSVARGVMSASSATLAGLQAIFAQMVAGAALPASGTARGGGLPRIGLLLRIRLCLLRRLGLKLGLHLGHPLGRGEITPLPLGDLGVSGPAHALPVQAPQGATCAGDSVYHHAELLYPLLIYVHELSQTPDLLVRAQPRGFEISQPLV